MGFSARKIFGWPPGIAFILFSLAGASSAQLLSGPETLQADLNGTFRYRVAVLRSLWS